MSEPPAAPQHVTGRPWSSTVESIQRFRELFDEGHSGDAQLLHDLSQVTTWTVGLAAGGIALLVGATGQAAFTGSVRAGVLVSLAGCVLAGAIHRLQLALIGFAARYQRLAVLAHLSIYVLGGERSDERAETTGRGGLRPTLSTRAEAFARLVSVVDADQHKEASDEAASLAYVGQGHARLVRRVKDSLIAFGVSQIAFVLAIGIVVGSLLSS